MKPASVNDPATLFAVQVFQSLHPPRPDGEKEAMAMLRQAAWQVQPIMKRRQWRIGILRELEPENMSRVGDNMNRGEVVRIKCRRPEGGLYDYEFVVKVLLHEARTEWRTQHCSEFRRTQLCHNEHGAHSASFYKLLDDISLECEELAANKQGGTGSGFDAKGEKLGSRSGATPHDPRAAAAEAAAKRAKAHAVMGGGGRLGGGDGGAKAAGLTPQQAAAAAAERRAAAQRFSKEFGLEDDVMDGPPVAQPPPVPKLQQPPPPPQRQAAQRPPQQVARPPQASTIAAPPRRPPPPPPVAPPPSQRPRLRFDARCVCGACDGRSAVNAQCPAVGATEENAIVLEDDDDDGGGGNAGGASAGGAAAGGDACFLCYLPPPKCFCWTCRSCTRRNVTKASVCDSCSTWRYAT